MDWIQIEWKPRKVGAYLVTTAKGSVIIDRWDGNTWGLCFPRAKTKSYYKMHKAWMPLPKPYKEDEL